MGNLEKAGVLVVVALLAVILVVAFLNFPDQGKTPVLGASAAKNAPVSEAKKPAPKPEAANIYVNHDSDVIRPRGDGDRSSSEAPPRLDPPVLLNPPTPLLAASPKPDDAILHPTPPTTPKVDPAPPVEEKKPAAPSSAWPKHVKVQSGESLWAIAVREYGAKLGPRMMGAIADANPKVRPEAMKTGTELALPAPPTEASVSKSPTEEAKDAKAAPKTSGAKAPAKEPAASKPARKLPFVPE